MRRFLTYIILLLAAARAWAGADGFTTLDWDALRIDSLLPVYTEVVPLETDYQLHTYTVTLDYPQYAPLTAREVQVVEKYDSLISDHIDVDSYVGVSRGEGMLDISFVPIIRREGRYMKLLSARVTIAPHRKANAVRRAASKRDRYVSQSVLSEGMWVKICITEDGMYQLTRSALKKMGFKNPENVHLYGYGGHLQSQVINPEKDYDDLQEVPLYYNAQKDNWLFWGNGLLYWNDDLRVRNHYANYACYFLTETDTPSSIETLPGVNGSPAQTFTTFPAHTLYEKEEFAWAAVGRHLVENANFASSSNRSYSLQTVESAGGERLTVAFTASTKDGSKLVPSVNGSELASMALAPIGKYISATAATNTFDVSSHAGKDHPEAWNVRLSHTAGRDGRLDYLVMHYMRHLKPVDGYVSFSQKGRGPAQFNITGSGLKVIRTGKPGSPDALVEGKQDGGIYQILVDDPTRQYVAFDPSATFPSPAVMGNVQPQNLHALDSLDMVIIIPASGKLQGQAQRLADAHVQHDGLRVGVVRADQIYNEFSSGTPDATAYRRFMKMLYDKALTPDVAPRYLLLMGDCAWDNRMLTSAWRRISPDDYLLCFESDESFSDTKSYVMEDYFGLLDDGEGAQLLRDKTDLGVGRFPVTSVAEAKVMVDKSISYMTNEFAGPWKNLIYMLGDDGDENEHMDYADRVAEQVKTQCPQLEMHKVMWDAYARVSTSAHNTYPEVEALLKKQMQDGALVMNYTGHGNANTMSHEFVLYDTDFENATSTNLPLWVTAACDIMPFDGSLGNIGEKAVLNPRGGALAFYGTARTVYALQNLAMNKFFMQYLFACDNAGNRYRLGDAVRLAKTSIIAEGREGSMQENKLQYALLGDPALVIGVPRASVVLDNINDQDLSSGTPVSLKAGQRVTISGHVQGADKNMLSAFDGVISARLFDSQKTVTCNNNAGASNRFRFTDQSTVLYESQDSVRGGRFQMTFIIPVDINYSNENGRFVFYAVNNDRTQEASGYSEQLTLGGQSDDMGADQAGPEIMAYLNNEDFQNGDVVNSTPFFVAMMRDESGISTSGNGVGHDLSLCIDGRADMTFNLNENYRAEFGDYTRGVTSFSIPTLTEGPHTLTFRAWDVLNNTSTATMDFVVNPSLKPHLLQLAATQNPAVTSTNFIISYDRPGSECTFTIEVFDFMGRRVWEHTLRGRSSAGVYTVPWDLTSGSGGRLGTGIYLYRCTMQCDESKEVSKSQKIIVLNNK